MTELVGQDAAIDGDDPEEGAEDPDHATATHLQQQDEANEDEASGVEKDGEAGDVEEVDTAGGQGAS